MTEYTFNKDYQMDWYKLLILFNIEVLKEVCGGCVNKMLDW